MKQVREQFGQRDVAVMYRVETASQQGNAADHGASQSRWTRKSLYSFASGLPGSGCQS